MLRAVIVDDEMRSRETLRELVLTYCPKVEIVGVAGSVNEAATVIVSEDPDLLFLDIEMPGGTGFDLLEKFPNPGFTVIFTTAYENYAVKAIQQSAMGYLLKPINIKELVYAVNRVIEELNSKMAIRQYELLMESLQNKDKKNQRIAVPTRNGLLILDIKSIIRCEADGNYTVIHSSGEEPLLTTRRIKEFDNILLEKGFFRVHNSHLINLTFLKEYIRGEGGFAVMVDGSEIQVSRRKKESFLEQLNRM